LYNRHKIYTPILIYIYTYCIIYIITYIYTYIYIIYTYVCKSVVKKTNASKALLQDISRAFSETLMSIRTFIEASSHAKYLPEETVGPPVYERKTIEKTSGKW
jgi:hypothetical protein